MAKKKRILRRRFARKIRVVLTDKSKDLLKEKVDPLRDTVWPEVGGTW